MKTLILTAVAFFALTGIAKADHIEDASFLQLLKTSSALKQATAQTVFDRGEHIDALTNGQLEKFQHVATEQAQIWGDTILEGDYQADGRTELDRVEELKIEGELVAYKITYSERSWDTSICTYPGNRDGSALDQCQEGRIVESSFVSPDLSSWTRDPENFAVFESL